VQARKATHGLDGQHQDVDRTLREIRMTEDRDKWRKYVHGVANPRIGSRMAKEQNRTVVVVVVVVVAAACCCCCC